MEERSGDRERVSLWGLHKLPRTRPEVCAFSDQSLFHATSPRAPTTRSLLTPIPLTTL